MLSIGEFANLTGLSVKALHHYDETRVLLPASVDAATGYRRYAESQVRDGALLQALRGAGVPLLEAAEVLRGGDPVEALSRHRSRVSAQRVAEDAAFEAADAVLAAFARPTAVEERRRPRTPFVARILPLPVDAGGGSGADGAAGSDEPTLTDDDANRAFAELYERSVEAGLEPGPGFWSSFREAPDSTAKAPRLQMLLCWPVARIPSPDGGGRDDAWARDGLLVGELPERTELFASWHADGASLPEGSVHPAVVALFDALAERGIRLATPEVRQHVLGEDADDFVVEVAITLPAERGR